MVSLAKLAALAPIILLSAIATRAQNAKPGKNVVTVNLGARELAFSKCVEPKHLSVEPHAFGAKTPLMPQNHHIVIVSRDDVRVHRSFCFRGLERLPGCTPTVRPGLETGECASIRE